MARRPRIRIAGYWYHVLNRSNSRRTIFGNPGEYYRFLDILEEGLGLYPVELGAYCIMPNHWHLALRPNTDTSLSNFSGWIANTHTRRVHMRGDTNGYGALYQGRFKNFLIQDESHLQTVVRYIERNAVRANLVSSAVEWPWSSLNAPKTLAVKLAPFSWKKAGWTGMVDQPLTAAEADALQNSMAKSVPFASDSWLATNYGTKLPFPVASRSAGRPPVVGVRVRASPANNNWGQTPLMSPGDNNWGQTPL